ncbi:HalOD1 output domain-containing protein [Halosimplex amylolyticum]|uniref:HalOD1 output domain-containing protein n=1 Tax=Halosimplex amylolyticum TaxID=3396616 RepID=UPI003F55FF32
MDNTACCHCTPVVGTRFDGDRERAPSTAVIEAVAAAEGVAPTELDPIYDAIDPEAIDRLLADQNDASTCVRFAINGWTVFVRGDGALRVCDPDKQTDPVSVFNKSLAD